MTYMIPEDHSIHQSFREVAQSTRIVVFSGLPGVGKSLYINEFYNIAHSVGRKLTVIQWDIARKGFETPLITKRFPMADSMVHDGLKLLAGQWLMKRISQWIQMNANRPEQLLLIEAPLVGHRFVEIVQHNASGDLEGMLSGTECKIIVPIPSKEVRGKIEKARASEVDEEAKSWMGAKPSVMQLLWKHVCEIAHEFGAEIDLATSPEYDPDIYQMVFEKVCLHRHLISLRINDIFAVPPGSENAFHQLESLVPTPVEADELFQKTGFRQMSDKKLSEITSHWYRQ